MRSDTLEFKNPRNGVRLGKSADKLGEFDVNDI